MTQEDRAEIERWFPGLSGTDWEITSPEDPDYNCLGFVLGFMDRFVDPSELEGTVWTGDAPRPGTLEMYIDWFGGSGLRRTDDEADDGSFRLAIFVNQSPQHFAVQLPSGAWTSKLGKSFDVTHPLRALEGSLYGEVAAILGRVT